MKTKNAFYSRVQLCATLRASAAVLLLALITVTFPCHAEIPPGWSTNLTATLNSASNRPVLLYFTATWCGPCKLMASTTLPDASVQSNLVGFARVALDLDANQTNAQRHSISGIPAFLVLTSAEDEILRTEGYQDADRFNAWLDKAKTAFAAAQEKLAAFVKQQATLDAALKSPDASVRKAALDGLFDLCADREPSHQSYVAAQLKAVAAREPKELLGGLEHSRLAARIAAANQLRDTLGRDFSFDPWASPAERAHAIAALRNSPSPSSGTEKPELERPQ
jgi:thioredoxin 1